MTGLLISLLFGMLCRTYGLPLWLTMLLFLPLWFFLNHINAFN